VKAGKYHRAWLEKPESPHEESTEGFPANRDYSSSSFPTSLIGKVSLEDVDREG
jgi:hypothetical protein